MPSKYPTLFAALIPDNKSREIIYVNKRLFSIARRRSADYVVPVSSSLDSRSPTSA